MYYSTPCFLKWPKTDSFLEPVFLGSEKTTFFQTSKHDTFFKKPRFLEKTAKKVIKKWKSLKSPIFQLFQKSPRPENPKFDVFFIFEFAPFLEKNELDLHSVFSTFDNFENSENLYFRHIFHVHVLQSKFHVFRFCRFGPKRAKNDVFLTFFWGKKRVFNGF